MSRLWVVVKIYNSKDTVDTDQFRSFCLDTYRLILNSFNNSSKWICLPPTVHSLLAHAWELVLSNGGQGLGEYTESGLEHNNKFLRLYRSRLSRKISQEANLEDCLQRLWLKSDPGIREASVKMKCKLCATEGHYTVSCPLKSTMSQTLNPLNQDEFFIAQLLL